MWNDAGALGRLTKWLLLLTVLLLIGTGFAWVYHSDHFPIKQVSIVGKLTRVDQKELQALAQKHLRGNIFRADLNEAGEAFGKLPWIDSAQVVRKVPDKMEIILTERIPVARWKAGGLVDSKGNIFPAEVEDKLPLFEGQPGTGKDMVKHYQEFTAILEPRNLAVKELVYTPRSAWSVVLENGVTVRLGRENETKRLQAFARIWPGLLAKNQNRIEYVDMRYKDGFAVRYSKTSEGPSESGSAN